jgi:UDP-N-acetylglucosamine acyltransferase
LRRRGFSEEQIAEIQNLYRILFVQNRNLAKAIEIIEAEYQATEIRDEILDFIRNSGRGIMKGFNNRAM